MTMEIQVPSRIELRILADGKPVAGLLCMVISGADYRTSFSFLAGPSDANGLLQVTRETIIASSPVKLNPDGTSAASPVTPQFTVFPMDLARLKSAKYASKGSGNAARLSNPHAESIDNAIAILSRDPTSKLAVELIAVDGEGTVRTKSIDPL